MKGTFSLNRTADASADKHLARQLVGAAFAWDDGLSIRSRRLRERA